MAFPSNKTYYEGAPGAEGPPEILEKARDGQTCTLNVVRALEEPFKRLFYWRNRRRTHARKAPFEGLVSAGPRPQFYAKRSKLFLKSSLSVENRAIEMRRRRVHFTSTTLKMSKLK